MRKYFPSENRENVSDLINEKICDFKANIHQYHAALNDEGVWLFLSALGCWGVADNRFKLFAFSTTFVLFVWRMNERRIEKRSFSKVIKALEDEIRSCIQEEVVRDATLYKLVLIQKGQLSWGSVMKRAWPFVVAWSFFGASFVYFISVK